MIYSSLFNSSTVFLFMLCFSELLLFPIEYDFFVADLARSRLCSYWFYVVSAVSSCPNWFLFIPFALFLLCSIMLLLSSIEYDFFDADLARSRLFSFWFYVVSIVSSCPNWFLFIPFALFLLYSIMLLLSYIEYDFFDLKPTFPND